MINEQNNISASVTKTQEATVTVRIIRAVNLSFPSPSPPNTLLYPYLAARSALVARLVPGPPQKIILLGSWKITSIDCGEADDP